MLLVLLLVCAVDAVSHAAASYPHCSLFLYTRKKICCSFYFCSVATKNACTYALSTGARTRPTLTIMKVSVNSKTTFSFSSPQILTVCKLHPAVNFERYPQQTVNTPFREKLFFTVTYI